MELHKLGIISAPEIIESCTDQQQIGRGVYITLPQEVADKNIQVEKAFRPCGLGHTSFVLPDKMLPISQVVWLCSTPQIKFESPAELKLEHCFQSKSVEHRELIKILKADHDDITRDKNGQFVIELKDFQGARLEMTDCEDGLYGILRDHHFCVYCLAVYCEEQEVLGHVHYCLTILKPTAYPKDKKARIYCLLHFDLEDCKTVRIVQLSIVSQIIMINIACSRACSRYLRRGREDVPI